MGKGQDIGYIRVSSLLQNEARQLEGMKMDHVFTDKVSCKDKDRPELKRCMEHLRAGDTLHVHSIDRLARNLRAKLLLLNLRKRDLLLQVMITL